MRKHIVKALAVTKLEASKIDELIEVPKEESHGDYSFPCFALAAIRKKNPVQIAQELANEVKLSKEIEKVVAVGPYLNFFVNRRLLTQEAIARVLKEKDSYGKQKLGGKKVMIEFSQANTHKAFHIGHVRGTSIGESLARVMELLGDNVTRANYQGDTGMHVAKWLWCYQTFHAQETLKADESWIAGIYVEAVKKLADKPDYEEEVKKINLELANGTNKKLNELWTKTRKLSLDAFKPIYQQLQTGFDHYFFEAETEKESGAMAQELVKLGIAKESEGATIIDFKDHGKPELGVWVLLRGDGTPLYSIKDMVLAKRKFGEFKIDQAIYVVASEQQLHLRQLFAALELMKFKQAKKCVHRAFNLVRLPTGKMSSRTGDNVLYSDFIGELTNLAKEEIQKRDKLGVKELEKRAEAIAVAALKYSMLKQDLNKILVFDKHEAVKFEGDTGPYLLYTYARAQSILRKVTKKSKLEVESVSDSERKLVSEIARYPEVVKHAYEQLEPQHLAIYAYQLAQTFNEFYHACKVIGEPNEAMRIALVKATTQTLKNALKLLAIPIIEQM